MCPPPCSASSRFAALAAVVFILTCAATSAWTEPRYYAAACSEVNVNTGNPAAGEQDHSARASRNVTEGPVPFRLYPDVFTWIPTRGVGQVSVGCAVERIYLLGCTVPAGRVLETYGYVDLVYADMPLLKDASPRRGRFPCPL
jgi:hypothetical protein